MNASYFRICRENPGQGLTDKVEQQRGEGISLPHSSFVSEERVDLTINGDHGLST
jgi:hypothetical protein